MSEDPEEIVRRVLADRQIRGAAKREALAEHIVDALSEEGYLTDTEVIAVGVNGARVPVETVEAYGLEISLDANGNAVEVTSPWGLAVTA